MTDLASEPGVRRSAPRRTRRPIPALVLLLLLALAALAVWFNVLSDEKRKDEARAAACSSAAAVPTEVDPATFTINVLNASDVAGEAGKVAETLRSRGFSVGLTENDRSGNEVTGVGEVRFGPGRDELARYVALQLPGAGERQDGRAEATVDVVIGPEFAGLATQDAVAAALVPPTTAGGACPAP